MADHKAISRIKLGDLDGLEIHAERYQAQAVHASYLRNSGLRSKWVNPST